MSSFTSSNTNQLMPAAGATFTRLGRMPCAPGNHALILHHITFLQAGRAARGSEQAHEPVRGLLLPVHTPVPVCIDMPRTLTL